MSNHIQNNLGLNGCCTYDDTKVA